MKFRKKPVVIEAQQFTGENAEEIFAWMALTSGASAGVRTETGALLIETLEGDMRADINDWIIRGVKGEFYPCKPDIFTLTYEAAGTEPEPQLHDHNILTCKTCESVDQYAQEQYRGYEEKIARVKELVDEQAADEGLWSFPVGRSQTISEAHLQQELRRLHAAIEEGL